MASRPCIATGSRVFASSPLTTSSQHNAFSYTIIRTYAKAKATVPATNASKYKRADKVAADRRRAKAARKTHFTIENLSKTTTYSLCDAMRFVSFLHKSVYNKTT